MGLPLETLTDLADASLAAVVGYWDGAATPLPERRYITFGSVVWDCESVAVITDSTFGTESDPSLELAATDPGLGYSLRAALIAVAILRCVPTEDDNGDPPTVEEIETSTRVILTDAIAVFNALQQAQAAGELATCQGLAFERWSTEAPQGGIGGGTIRIRALML